MFEADNSVMNIQVKGHSYVTSYNRDLLKWDRKSCRDGLCIGTFIEIYSRFSRSFTAREYLLGNPPGYKANKL